MQADIFDLLRVDRRQRLGHAVDERLAADEADARIAKRLRDQVLGPTEADLEADVVDRAGNSAARSCAGLLTSTTSRGSSVSNNSAWFARKGCPLRRPKNAP